jgi:hypothetical protein
MKVKLQRFLKNLNPTQKQRKTKKTHFITPHRIRQLFQTFVSLFSPIFQPYFSNFSRNTTNEVKRESLPSPDKNCSIFLDNSSELNQLSRLLKCAYVLQLGSNNYSILSLSRFVIILLSFEAASWKTVF